jgi:ethanolamine utilization protein EutA
VNTVNLIGLDVGTTTSSAVIASAQLLTNSVTGRTDLANVQERYRSDIVFTPFAGDRLDLPKLTSYLDTWLAAGAAGVQSIFGGGALLTGLAAQKENAAALVRIIRERVGGAFIARADDPCLESWMAFMGSCVPLSRQHPQNWFLNLDIGGGATNLALGRAGEVVRTGCLFVGARHLEVLPGTYRIRKLSTYARRLLDHLGIRRNLGEELRPQEVSAVVSFYLRLLDAAVHGRRELLEEPIAQLHQQVAFQPVVPSDEVTVTLSGGVGELVYAAVQGKPLPPTTAFGDLGIDLAERLLDWPGWASHLQKYVPTGGGRATVYGLVRHATQVAGHTVFLSQAARLPLEAPLFGTLTDASLPDHLQGVLDLVKRSSQGGCVQLRLKDQSASGIRMLGARIADALRALRFPANHPLVVLVPDNVGKVLGQYITQWGSFPLALVVLDEIAIPDAQYVRIGAPQQQVLPVAFHGLQA